MKANKPFKIALPTLILVFILTHISTAQLWVELNEELGAVTDIAKVDGNLYTISNTGILGFSNDDGANWDTTDIYSSVNLENGILTCIGFFDGEEGIIGVRDIGLGNEILRTQDAGKTWTAEEINLVDTCVTSYIPITVNIVDDSTAVMLGLNSSSYRLSQDNGFVWGCNTSLTSPPSLQTIYIKEDGTWIINDLRGIYTSIDRGENWEQVINKRTIHHQLLGDSIHIALSSTFDEDDGVPRLIISKSDFSSSSVIELSSFKDIFFEHFVAISEDEIFILLNGTDVYYSSNGGVSFKLTQVLRNQPFRTLIIENEYFLAGRGLWKLDRSLSSVNDSKKTQRVKIYPNPSEHFLYIENQEYKSYQIFSIQGKLINEGRNTDNSIDVSNLINGTYLLKIITNEGQIVEKFSKI